ncbi:MAG: hypothetical protein AAF927_01690 [Bacteroidota bacterium]
MRPSRIILLVVIGLVLTLGILSLFRKKPSPELPSAVVSPGEELDELIERAEISLEKKRSLIELVKNMKSANEQLAEELETRTETLSQNGAEPKTSDSPAE